MFILSLYGLLADYVHIYQHEHKSLMHKTRPCISSLPPARTKVGHGQNLTLLVY